MLPPQCLKLLKEIFSNLGFCWSARYKLDRVALLSLLSKSKDKKEGAKRLRRLMLLLRKYPQYRKDFKENMTDMRNNLNQVLDAFEEGAEDKEGVEHEN